MIPADARQTASIPPTPVGESFILSLRGTLGAVRIPPTQLVEFSHSAYNVVGPFLAPSASTLAPPRGREAARELKP